MTKSLAERFEEKVDRSPGHGPWGDCHLWTASTSPKGYGQIRAGGTMARSHRVAWFLRTGVWPVLNVLHTCDNPPCVRFDHLFLGTDADNSADRESKGRNGGAALAGELHLGVKLTEQQVFLIRNDPRAYVDIAEQFGIHSATVSKIKTRKRWRHLE